MSETLVIEWGRDRLLAALGSAESSSVKIQSAVSIDRQGGELLPSELGEKLAAGLKSVGVTANEAIVVFERNLVTFSRITLPNIGDDEIPEMVKMQAATRLTVPVESVYMDFAPLPIPAGSETRDVLLVTVPRQYINQVKEALDVCAIELKGVRVSSFGIAASVVHSGLMQKNADSRAVETIIALGSDSIEMIFMSGHNVAFSHSGASWTSIEAIEQAVRSEISRARMAAEGDMGSYVVRRLTLIGSPDVTAAVPDSITKRLNDADVARVDPQNALLSGSFTGISATDLLAIAGVVANVQTPSVTSVDLVNPRRTPEKSDYSRVKKLLLAGVAVLALVGGWKWREAKVTAIQKEVAAVSGEVEDMEGAYKLASNELKLAANLASWSDRDISWLDEMQKLQGLMGGTDRVFIKKFNFHLMSGDYIAAFDAEGYAKSRRDIEDLMRVLTEAGYEVKPTEITQSLKDPNYNMELRLEVNIPTPPKEKPAVKA